MMVNDKELAVLKKVGEETKTKNLWIRVYNDETDEDGLISVLDILKTFIKESEVV